MSLIKRASEIKLNPNEYLIENFMPAESISVICGADGNINSLVATEIALSLSCGEDWHGKEIDSPQQALYITADKNKVTYSIPCIDSSKAYTNTPLATMSEPIDLLNKSHLDELIRSISICNQNEGLNEFPGLIVIDIQGGLTDEQSPNQLIHSIDYLRSMMGSAFLLVFNEGTCEECNTFTKIFNDADAVHRVTSTDSELGVRLSCIKMKNFAKPGFVEFDISCDESSLLGGAGNGI